MNREERRALGDRGPKVPSVELAFIHPGDVSAAFMSSVMRCRDYELMRTQQLFAVRERRARSGSIAKARNEVTTMFLRSQTEYLWFVDADMGFSRDALQQLLAVADPTERPIVSALCFGHRTGGFDEETNSELFETFPTLALWERNDEDEIIGFNTAVDYPRGKVCEVDTSGAACVLIHRSVLERIQAAEGDNWWSQLPHPLRSEPFGEDTSFFLRVADLGVRVFAHAGVRTSHDKGGVFLTERVWDEQEQRLRDVGLGSLEG